MKKIEIYTTATCPYCIRAKALLNKKGAAFEEIRGDLDPSLRPKMVERAKGRTTVPQIFIGGRHVGGCDDLHDLDYEGQLDPLLAD